MVLDWDSRTLYLVDGFTIALMPELSSVASAMLQFLGAAITNPGLGLLFAVIGGISMWALEALFYIRMILLYVYLYGLPIAFALAYGKHSGRIRYRDGVLQTVCPVGRPPAPRCDGPQGIRLDLRWGRSRQEQRSSNILSLRPSPAGRTLHHVEDVQIRDPVDGQKSSAVRRKAQPSLAVSPPGPTSVAPASRRPPLGGAKAAAGHAVAQKAAARGGHGADDSGAPSYRRTENDPGGATAESTSDGRGMDFDRGIH